MGFDAIYSKEIWNQLLFLLHYFYFTIILRPEEVARNSGT